MHTLLWLLMSLFTCLAYAADTEATTSDGRTVLLHEDGTWTEKGAEDEPPEADFDPDDCSTVVKTTTDRVSGNSFVSLADPLVISDDGKTGFVITALRSGENPTVIWGITAAGARACIDGDAKANILFTDGSRLEIVNNEDFNCKGKHTTYYGGRFGKKSELKTLSTKQIDVLRVWTRDGYMERAFKPKQAQRMQAALACLQK